MSSLKGRGPCRLAVVFWSPGNMSLSTLVFMYQYKKEQSRQCVWEAGRLGRGKMRCIVSAAGKGKPLSGCDSWLPLLPGKCVSTPRRGTSCCWGRRRRCLSLSLLGLMLAPQRCLCHKQERSQGVVCFAFSPPAQTTTTTKSHLCYVAVRLFAGWIIFSPFFTAVRFQDDPRVFTGFEGCCWRGNSTAASNPGVCNILSWPCWMCYIRSETFCYRSTTAYSFHRDGFIYFLLLA